MGVGQTEGELLETLDELELEVVGLLEIEDEDVDDEELLELLLELHGRGGYGAIQFRLQ
jgi:hypothetical protein